MATKKLMLTGECWCGCGEATAEGVFFLKGHDKRAESWLIRLKHGSVARFLDDNGYGPGKRNLKDAFEKFEKKK